MYLTEWDEEAYRTVLKQESWEDGRAEGLAEGKAKERNDVNELIQCLLRDNRIEDLKRSTTDTEFQNSLMAEYGIGAHIDADATKTS